MFSSKSKISIASSGSKKSIITGVQKNSPNRSMMGAKAPKNQETALYGYGAGQRNTISMSAIGGRGQTIDKMLTGLLNDQHDHLLRDIYKDIYEYDAVGGSACDLMSTLPFSDFSLGGLDEVKLARYQSSIDRLNIRSLAPEITLEYLVMGAFLGTLVYRKEAKAFTDIIPHSLNEATITEMPFYSLEPVIDVKANQKVKDFLSSDETYIVKYRNSLNQKLVQAMQSGEYTLDPMSTLYLPRRTFSDGQSMSFLRRMVPVYLLEKVLFRGTLVEATKRQRSLLHLAAGDENWEPTSEELSALVSIFQQADLDPLGAIIATRQSITPSEVRQGGDFWKYTDIIDQTTPLKLRALGISESFLSGEASYNTADVALSVFIENIKSYRDSFTHKVFQNTLFPAIAVANGFYKEGRAPADSDKGMSYELNDNSRFEMPTVQWHKSLNPKNDRDTLETLTTLTEKGMPITLRMWAAAGGMNINNLESELEEDKALRARLAKFKDTPAGGEGGFGGFEGSGVQDFANGIKMLGSLKRVGIMNRDFGEASEITTVSKTGQKKSVYNQHRANEVANLGIAKALQNLSDPHHYQSVISSANRRLNAYGKA